MGTDQQQQMTVAGQSVPWRLWDPGMCPLHGPELALDTETEAFTDRYTVPPLVLLQVSDGRSVDLVPWQLADKYLKGMVALSPPDMQLYLFNAGFDLAVLGSKLMYDLVDANRVIDLAEEYCVFKIAQQGYYPQPVSLANVSRELLNVVLAKDESVRLTFRRDAAPTQAQLAYAATDAYITHRLAHTFPRQPTNHLQTKAAIVLDAIGRNGMLVNMDKFAAKVEQLEKELELASEALGQRGFPLDSGTPLVTTVNTELTLIGVKALMEGHPGRNKARLMLYHVLVAANAPADQRLQVLEDGMAHVNKAKYSAAEKRAFDELMKELNGFLDALGLGEMAASGRAEPFMRTARIGLAGIRRGHDLAVIQLAMQDACVLNRGWADNDSRLGPVAFLQQHMTRMESQHGIAFDRTPGGQMRVSKKDKWMLKERGIQDPLLEDYMAYKSLEKLLSTYFNPKHICADGRMHPRFRCMLRTGRTGCSNPNLQNPPKKGGYREVFEAPAGRLLGIIDYGKLELCTLAQHCYTRFGHSRLRDIINAGIDPHRWFAGKKIGWLRDDNDYDGTEPSAQAVKSLIKDVPEKDRGEAKSSNFGFPGGMREKRFYLQCRMDGMDDMTLDKATDLRTAWFRALPEMDKHMQPQECGSRDPKKPDDPNRYEACTLTGRLRRYCSFNSACNYPLTDGGYKTR
jgi:hypothetical protein